MHATMILTAATAAQTTPVKTVVNFTTTSAPYDPNGVVATETVQSTVLVMTVSHNGKIYEWDTEKGGRPQMDHYRKYHDNETEFHDNLEVGEGNKVAPYLSAFFLGGWVLVHIMF